MGGGLDFLNGLWKVLGSEIKGDFRKAQNRGRSGKMGEIGPILQPNGFGPKKRFNLTPKLAPLGGVFYGKPSKSGF